LTPPLLLLLLPLSSFRSNRVTEMAMVVAECLKAMAAGATTAIAPP